jgi:hypothetical protein
MRIALPGLIRVAGIRRASVTPIIGGQRLIGASASVVT